MHLRVQTDRPTQGNLDSLGGDRPGTMMAPDSREHLRLEMRRLGEISPGDLLAHPAGVPATRQQLDER